VMLAGGLTSRLKQGVRLDSALERPHIPTPRAKKCLSGHGVSMALGFETESIAYNPSRVGVLRVLRGFKRPQLLDSTQSENF